MLEKRPIKDYENYLIDTEGNVYNTTTNKPLKGSISEHGYKYYRLSKDGKKKMFYAHRLVAEMFLSNPNNFTIVNHIDGNKLNNNISNLEWTTQSDNMLKAHQNGLIKPVRKKEYYEKDLEGELWKQIPNWPYFVSSCGRVRNERTYLLLKPVVTCGYYKVRLSLDGHIEDKLIHKLVYMVFNDMDEIPNGMVIDHIDGDKLNNNLSNLRLVSLSENVQAAFYTQKTNKACKAVLQFDLNGKFIAEFPSTKEAARQLNLDSSTISKVCRGQNKTHGGFVFKYKDN